MNDLNKGGVLAGHPQNSAAPGTQLASVNGARSWPPPLPLRLAAMEEDYRRFCFDCLSELGGPEEATAKEILLLESTAELMVLRRKCGRNLLSRGISKRGGDLRGPMKAYVALVNAERQGLIAFGLKRRARQVLFFAGCLVDREGGADTPGGAEP